MARGPAIGLARALLGGALIALAVLAARMLLGARSELAAAHAAAASGDDEREQRHLRRALAYYLPWSPWLRRAHDELLALARRADRRGDRAAALAAYLDLRSAILAQRGLLQPFAATLPEANARIAELMRRDPDAAPALASARGSAALRGRLERPADPDPLWAGLGLTGFAIWTVGAFVLVAAGLRPDARLVGRRFWPLLGAIALGLALFCAGMAWA